MLIVYIPQSGPKMILVINCLGFGAQVVVAPSWGLGFRV